MHSVLIKPFPRQHQKVKVFSEREPKSVVTVSQTGQRGDRLAFFPFLFLCFHEIVSRDGDECACVSLPFGSALASHREECVCAPLIRAGVVEQDSERVASCSAFLFSSFVKRLVCGGAVPVKRSCCGGAVRSKLLMRRFTGVCRELLRALP